MSEDVHDSNLDPEEVYFWDGITWHRRLEDGQYVPLTHTEPVRHGRWEMMTDEDRMFLEDCGIKVDYASYPRVSLKAETLRAWNDYVRGNGPKPKESK